MDIEERVKRLEVANKRLRLLLLIILSLGSSIFLMGQTSVPGEIVTRGITLVNDRGERIGEFGTRNGKVPYFAMRYVDGPTVADVIEMSVGELMSTGADPSMPPRIVSGNFRISRVVPGYKFNGNGVDISVTDNSGASLRLFDGGIAPKIAMFSLNNPKITTVHFYDDAGNSQFVIP